MIGKHIRQIKRYCKDPIEWIENYQEAISDKIQKWECHHKKEIELGGFILGTASRRFDFFNHKRS